MEQISTFYLKFMPSASDPTSIQPHICIVKGPDLNLPVESGLVDSDGLDQRWLNFYERMQW